MPQADRKSYDTGIAGTTEDSINTIINRLETLLNERDRQAKAALADFRMTNTDEEYHRVETRWQNASKEVREIITILRQTIGKNTQTASQAMTKASVAVANIG